MAPSLVGPASSVNVCAEMQVGISMTRRISTSLLAQSVPVHCPHLLRSDYTLYFTLPESSGPEAVSVPALLEPSTCTDPTQVVSRHLFLSKSSLLTPRPILVVFLPLDFQQGEVLSLCFFLSGFVTFMIKAGRSRNAPGTRSSVPHQVKRPRLESATSCDLHRA